MAYQRPLVMVFQEYAKQSVATQTATLYPCVIGPCYHIIDPVEDSELAFAGNYSIAGMSDVLFPNNKPGAEIVEGSSNFLFENVEVELNDEAINVSSIDDNTVTFSSDNFPDYVQVGDTFRFEDNTDLMAIIEVPGDYRVIGINADEYQVILNKSPLTGEGTSFQANITREFETFYPEDDYSYITTDAAGGTFSILGATYMVDGVEKIITAADVYVGYKALRMDLSEINTVYNTSEAEGLLGKIDTPDNPLGMAAAITLANTSVGVKVIGVTSDDISGYTAAKDLLESYSDVYAMVPLSQDASILNIFKQHAEQMSLPEQGNWRVAIGSTQMATETQLEEGFGQVKEDGEGDLILFQDMDAMFMSNNVAAGDILNLDDDGGDTYEFTIASVISEDLLSVTPSTPFDANGFVISTDYDYDIVRPLNKTEQAEAVRAVSQSFGSKRFVHVWPDVVTIDDKKVPGYYLACTVAGATGGLPSHHGFTRLSVSGIQRLYNSGDYFNQDQLDTIADGGTFIFTQAQPQAAPVIRHQLTTDRSTIETSEFSFVKNFDYVSILCKDVLDKFLGKYNITPATLAVLETAVRSVLESLKLYKLPKIGSPVLGYEVVNVEQLDDIRDRVEMYVNVRFPYVLNTVGLHLISQ